MCLQAEIFHGLAYTYGYRRLVEEIALMLRKNTYDEQNKLVEVPYSPQFAMTVMRLVFESRNATLSDQVNVSDAAMLKLITTDVVGKKSKEPEIHALAKDMLRSHFTRIVDDESSPVGFSEYLQSQQ